MRMMNMIEELSILLLALAFYMRMTGHRDWFDVFAIASGSVMGAWLVVFFVVMLWDVLIGGGRKKR